MSEGDAKEEHARAEEKADEKAMRSRISNG
jgi:hypothetical protein